MDAYSIFVPPHYAVKHEDEELGQSYSQWVDGEDRDHISGKVGENRWGAWVSHPGIRMRIVDGEVEAYKKETTIIEDLDIIDDLIEQVEGKL